MLVKEGAEYLGIPTGQLLDQLKIKFPGEKITANSELPESFIEQIESFANNIQDASASNQPKPTAAGGMGMALAKDSVEAITNVKSTSVSISECVRQALEDSELVLAIQQGFRDALVIEDAYQSAKAQAIDAMVESRSQAVEQELERVKAERESFLVDRAEREQQRLGEWVRKREESRMRLQRVHEELAALRNLF
ncbi:hypothetical protein [Anabaena sp. CCY 9402-a]|uniref:hypothetical protein n=1 Tax=Anabaena sp. CCY 9402-a TaxID=3103867 RepID=UPI0039C6FCBB